MEHGNQLGKFLESLRGKMSLRKVASKSGLSHAYIRDLELGRNRTTNDIIKPSPDTLRKLSQAYQYPYTDLLMKAGYLEEASSMQTNRDIRLEHIWYVEFGAKSIKYYSAEGVVEENVESLVAFTSFIEALMEQQFAKVDMHLFVNLNKIKKYAPAEGKLYFDEHADHYVGIAALPQMKYHQTLLEYEARNNGLPAEVEAGSRRSSLKTKFLT
ncbi:helix-turn-helix domain-containing protein [Paenibacillus sp. GCM10023248]|uniref:helix-turn-helix domain-containing protein n=1 Tax=Bacillales TaxID=1385 RepID=UPI002377F65E|nr:MULTISPECIES: helix-turn-helix transcriptional regulator [Bacillales]MDD9266419.1 helix-turn-helix transcriptional regulator [Paenibacillus sp. MAHUQ-63]MDR6878544.1 transcriptional regulator with XRE-family HTH domain [Bacillus sp. 3255]